ncbi:AP-2 complex subunit mu [Trypanosoma grayi]|uniref:AP-2 complex subunit mu n=1 Tax=Trypanosoma grayi TaxID=71804 RepID=M4T028_9TRYP|nr:AP-2 complex subunit mu [Trypanosoma grayi]AGH62038.1 AP-2 complex subunit mu [Trypanosoma grayi]KEG12810.1 AP-2 complex subunit mu [Trypanosoma grayi]
MIGVLMFLNSRGDVVLSRTFRDGYSVRGLAEGFRNQLISTKVVDRSPINIVDGVCYVHVRFHDMYLVLVSNGNVNCFTCLQYALQLLDICNVYFENVEEDTLKDNFVALQQLIDETMDFGYPQTTEVVLLKSFLNAKGIDITLMKKPQESQRVTARMTKKMPWREKGLWYRANDLFVDVFEELHVLVTQTGQVLENSAVGRMVVKNFLSGMPECQLVLHDNFAPEDAFYHPCVQVTPGRGINFVPVDGVFVLMWYRTAMHSPPPLKVLHARVKEVSKTRTEMEFGLKCEMPDGMCCTEVEVRVPCPANTADVRVNVERGSARFDGVKHAIIWKLPTVTQKDAEMLLSAEIVLLASTLAQSDQMWSRPPIKISFSTPSRALSGFHVKELRVEEPELRYTPSKWIRYATKAGQYEWRL